MPSRSLCVAILLFWAVASVGLITRDVLPDLMVGPPPDFRSIASSDPQTGPAKWAILVADDASLQNLRSVGQAVTESTVRPDGWLVLKSKVWFDSGDMLRGTAFGSVEGVKIDVDNSCEIDPSGNLKTFRAVVQADGSEVPLLTLDGAFRTIDEALRKHVIEVSARGPIEPLNFIRQFPYEPKTMLQHALGPIDRLPGLAVGQRWEARVVSPLTGKIEVVKAEVVRRSEIYWDKTLVSTYEVVQKIPPAITARTWVRRSDGLVLRQEVPFPVVKLLIERMPAAQPSS